MIREQLPSARALELIIPLVKDPEPKVRLNAVSALGLMAYDPAADILDAQMVKEEDAEVYEYILLALERYNTKAFQERILRETKYGNLDVGIRQIAARAFRHIDSGEALLALLKLIEDWDHNTQMWALESLRSLDLSKTRKIWENLLHHSDPSIRLNAREALGKTPS
jgi:HEAT repeat protein